MKSLFAKVMFAVVTLAALFWAVTPNGNFAPFITLFSASALAFSTSKPTSFAVCVTPCGLGTPTSNSDANCAAKGGVRRGYWAKYSDIDWAAMRVSALHWNNTTKTILGFIFLNSAEFIPVPHDLKTGEANADFSRSDGFYKNSIKVNFMGQSPANRKIFEEAIGCCNLVYVTVSNACSIRVWGVDDDGAGFSPLLTPLTIDKNSDKSGTLGGTNAARNEIELVGESLVAPLFYTSAEATLTA